MLGVLLGLHQYFHFLPKYTVVSLSSFLPFLGQEVAILEDLKFGSCTWS